MKKCMLAMPRHIQEEKLEEFLNELEKDPTFNDDALLDELDSDLLEVVEAKLEKILDEVLMDIEDLQCELYELERGEK